MKSQMMSTYPVSLNLIGKRCVVVGGGCVAARKVNGLLDADAVVTVISPKLVSALEFLAVQDRIEWRPTEFNADNLKRIQPFLVFAATDSPVVNLAVAHASHQIGALVNVVDGTSESDFSNMSVVRRASITIGISTNGTSPALATYLKQRIEELIGDEYVILAQWLSELRPELQTLIHNQTDRSRLYEAIIASDVLTLLREHDTAAAFQRFQDIVLAEQVAS